MLIDDVILSYLRTVPKASSHSLSSALYYF